MKNLMIAAALASSLCGLVDVAQAMPVSGMSAGAPAIELVAGGCGPGFHRGPYGGCQPNGFYGRPVYRPRVYAPRVYAPPVYGPRCFWRQGPYGARRICRY